MTGLERVLAAVRGERPDQPAVSMTLSLYGSRLTGCPLTAYYTRPDCYAEGQQAIKETFDADILFTPFTLASIGEAFGSRIVYFDHSPPNVAEPGCTSGVQAAKCAQYADIEENGMTYLLESARLLAAKHGKNTAIGGVFLSPVDLPPLLMGMEGWLNTLLFEEREARRILEGMSRFFVEAANALFDNGIHLLVLPLAFCNPRVLTPGMVDRMVMPVLMDAFADVKGPIMLHHVGLPITPFLGSLTQLPQVVGYVLDSTDSFEKARKAVGNQPVLMGNVDGPTLYRKNPDGIRDTCRKLYVEREHDPHFLLATSGADIPLQTPMEHIQALKEAAAEWGRGS